VSVAITPAPNGGKKPFRQAKMKRDKNREADDSHSRKKTQTRVVGHSHHYTGLIIHVAKQRFTETYAQKRARAQFVQGLVRKFDPAFNGASGRSRLTGNAAKMLRKKRDIDLANAARDLNPCDGHPQKRSQASPI